MLVFVFILNWAFVKKEELTRLADVEIFHGTIDS